MVKAQWSRYLLFLSLPRKIFLSLVIEESRGIESRGTPVTVYNSNRKHQLKFVMGVKTKAKGLSKHNDCPRQKRIPAAGTKTLSERVSVIC